jgi:hypothetical protein
MTNRNATIISTALIVAAGFWIVGLIGLTKRVTISTGSCASSYAHYYIKPFIRDYFNCRRMTPCGTDERLDRYNAAVDTTQCLCENSQQNYAAISQIYDSELTTFLGPITNRPSVVTFRLAEIMCGMAREMGRQ